MTIEAVNVNEVLRFYSAARQRYIAAGDMKMAAKCDLAIGDVQHILWDPRILPLRTL